MLPDVDTQSWQDYSAERFSAGADRKIGALTFSTAADQRISDLGGLTTGTGAPAPATPPSQPAPPVAPAETPTSGLSLDSPVLNLDQPPPMAPDAPLPSPARSSAVAPSDLIAQALNAADEAGVDPGLYAQVIQQESAWNPRAQSPAGAQGLSQLMPDTARGLGVSDPFDVGQNLKAGARYLKQQIDRFGGDVVKGLAAYNAGAGNVEKYGGVPPFQETQRYVDNIMSALAHNQGGVGFGDSSQAGPALVPEAGQQARPSADISQFGDPQLTADEAYAACGPAAAVRFAQRFGRNPTLREALDLAKQGNLWDVANGMHGLAAEQAELDKLQVASKMVNGPQWAQFAAEAQTGNPVIISTAGHYFTADGFDQTSGKFHVGKSGLDLKGGAEWMSPADMERLMGTVQGGLLADNPQVPAPSTADQQSNPVGWLDRAKDAISSSIGNVASAVGGMFSNQPSTLAGSAGPVSATGEPASMPSDVVQRGQEALRAVPDAAGQALQTDERQRQIAAGQENLRTDLQGDPTGLGTGVMVNANVSRVEQRADVAQGQALANQVVGMAKAAGWQPTPEQERFAHDTLSQVTPMNVLMSVAGAGEGISARALVEGLTGLGLSAVGSTAAINAAGDANLPEGARTAAGVVGAVAAPVLGHTVIGGARSLATSSAVRNFAADEEGALRLPGRSTQPTAPAYQSVMPAGTFEPAPGTTSTGRISPSGVADAATQWITQHLTDRDVSLSRVQQAYAKALGRPLNADEMVYELKRLNPDAAAAVHIDENLRPAIQSVGNDYNALRDYVTLRSNVQVAEGIGTRVQAAGVARDVPSNLTADLNGANTSVRMRQDALNNLQNAGIPDQARIQVAQRSLNAAARRAQRAQDAIDTWQQSNLQQATSEGATAALNRQFSGGLTRDESQARLAQLEQQLGPDRFATVQTAANQVSDFSRQLRQRLVDSGVLTADQAAEMDRLYPDWAKTRVLDYMKDPAGGQGAGTKIGLADRNLRQYSVEGTQRAREDPLASMVAYAHQVESMALKNDTFNALRQIDQASPTPLLRKVPQDFTPTKNQVTVVGFENGEKVKYVTDNKALGEAINGTSILPVPEWTKAWGHVFRSLATSRNPVFLAGNAALDIPTYVIRESVRAGGPQHLPAILGELARGYTDAAQGLFQGQYRGEATARFLKGGGGQSGYFTGAEGTANQAVADLRRSNVFQISSKADLLRLGKDVVTLKPVEAMGERIELGPRVASMRLAEQRGANPVQAVINGRTVTVDFSQGGDVTKYINNFVPFFNVAAQSPAQVVRAFRENPAAFAWTMGALLGAPAIAAEAWNRSDPQRAKDYADVPQYLKDQGIVIMLPGTTPVDAQGNRKPLYAVLKLREWAPFASLARDAAGKVLGDNTKDWADVAGSAAKGFSPTNASSIGQLGTEALSGIPVLPAAAQIELNRDFFRNRDIVTRRADENASAVAKTLSPIIQSAMDKLGYNVEIRPSAVDFFIRNQGAGVGGAVLGGSDLVAGKARQDTSPTSLPGIGGLVGRFVGSQTGQSLQTARDEALTPSARDILRRSGITTTPGPITSDAHGIPLRMDEETRAQQLANRYIDDAIHRTAAAADFAGLPQAGKEARMQAALAAARARAEGEVLSSIPQAERDRRRRAQAVGR